MQSMHSILHVWLDNQEFTYCVSEGKLFEASNAAIISAMGSQKKQVKLREDETIEKSNANMAVTLAGITTGLIVMAFIIFGIIAMTQKRGMFHLAQKWNDGRVNVLQLCLWNESILCELVSTIVMYQPLSS
jgi:hypothetical protein